MLRFLDNQTGSPGGLDAALLDAQPNAIAVFDLQSLMLVQGNSAFYTWAEGDLSHPPADLPTALPTLDVEKMRARLERRGLYKHTDVARLENEARRFPVEYELRTVVHEGARYLALTGHDRGPVQAKDLMLQSYARIIERHTRTVERQKQALAELLDNMQQGVFTVDEQWTIQAPVSRFTEQLFGRPVEGESLWSIMLNDVKRKSVLGTALETVMAVAMGEDELQWILVEDELPAVLDWESPEGEARRLKVAWRPLWDEEGLLKRIMLVVEDITEMERLGEALRAERAAQDRRLQVLQELADLDRSMLEGFFPAAAQALQRARHALDDRWPPQGEAVGQLFRTLHTLKGNARALHLSAIATSAHELEAEVEALRAGQDDWQLREAIQEDLSVLERAVGEYNALALRVFGIHDAFQEALAEEIHARALRLFAALRGSDLHSAHQHLHQIQEASRGILDEGQAEECAASLAALHGAISALMADREPTPGALVEASSQAARHLVSLHLRPRKAPDDQGRSWVGMHRGLLALTEATQVDPTEAALQAQRLARQARSLGLDHLHALAEGCEAALMNGAHEQWQSLLDRMWRFAGWLAHVQGHCLSQLHGARPDADLQALSPQDQARWLGRLSAALPDEQSVSDWLIRDTIGPVAPIDDALRAAISPAALIQRLKALAGNPIATLTGLLLSGEPLSRPGEGYTIRADILRQLQRLRQAEGYNVALPRMVPVLEEHLRALEDHFHLGLELRQPVSQLFDLPAAVLSRPFESVIQETARMLSKTVNFRFVGAHVPIHRARLGPLQDALVHLLRNAIDHGIEAADDRLALGKPAVGQIELRVTRAEAGLSVELRDDGKGIDPHAVRSRSVAKGLISEGEALKLDEEGLLALVFEAGMSTADQISEISGRGVGLDAVQESIRQLGGEVKLRSDFGHGTSFFISLPL